jgi:hypothetical protein
LSHQQFAEYQCGVCHKLQRQVREAAFYQCAVCATFLCPNCDNDGLCPAHYAVLKSSDQDMLAVFAEKEVKLNSRLCDMQYLIDLFACFPIGFLIVIFFIFFTNGFNYGSTTTPFFIAMVIFTGILVVAHFYRSQLRVQRATIKITVEGILLRYPELKAIIEGRLATEDQEASLEEN